jgi:uncharacterized RDD family membrane protein YckC
MGSQPVPVAVTQPPQFCTECGGQFGPDDLIRFGERWVCAGCKNTVTQKLREGVPLGAGIEYAGFWIRFAALLIDGIIGWVIGAAFNLAVLGSMFGDPNMAAPALLFMTFVGWCIGACYEGFFLWKLGATPGKLVFRLKVITPGGGRISFVRGFARYFAKILSGAMLCIGYIIAAFDSEKRGLHDYICGTRVIHGDPYENSLRIVS